MTKNFHQKDIQILHAIMQAVEGKFKCSVDGDPCLSLSKP